MSDEIARDGFVLRRRRVGGGYRVRDVESVLGQLFATVHRLEFDLGELRGRANQLEAELKTARQELGGYRSQEARLAQTLRRAEESLTRVEDLARGVPAEPSVQ